MGVVVKALRVVVFLTVAGGLAGCASAPDLTSAVPAVGPVDSSFSSALKKTHYESKWSTGFRLSDMNASVGPAPLFAAGSVRLDASGIDAARDLNTITSVASIAYGSDVIGVWGLLSQPASPSLRGFYTYKTGIGFYAVRLYGSLSAAKASLLSAAKFEVHLPLYYGGEVVGGTGYRFGGNLWEPYRVDYEGSRIFCLRYKPEQMDFSAPLQPSRVWITDLSPMVRGKFAVTDQWDWTKGTAQTGRIRYAKIFSKKYPDWYFVTVNRHEESFVCKDGVCFNP